MLKTSYNEAGDVLTFKLSGRIDTIVSAGIGEDIRNEVLKHSKTEDKPLQTKIVFDLADVTYIASSFIRICLSTAKQVDTGNFCIINCDPFIKKTFKIAGLDEILGVI